MLDIHHFGREPSNFGLIIKTCVVLVSDAYFVKIDDRHAAVFFMIYSCFFQSNIVLGGGGGGGVYFG